MGNCLKTQLKEKVSNDNLIAFGNIKFEFSDSENNGNFLISYIRTQAGYDILLKKGTVTLSGTNYTAPATLHANEHFGLQAVSSDVVVETPNYGIYRCENSYKKNTFDFSGLKYNDGMMKVNLKYLSLIPKELFSRMSLLESLELDYSNLNDGLDLSNNSNLTKIYIVYPTSAISLSSIILPNDKSNLTEITLGDTINGTIDYFKDCLACTKFVLRTGIRGAIEDLATLMDGRRDGTSFTISGSQITYNGSTFSGEKTITFANGTHTIS